MISRPHTQLALFALVAAGLCVWALGVTALLILVAALLIATAAVLGLQLTLMSAVNRNDPCPRPSRAEWFKAWWLEWLDSVRLFGIWQPFLADVEKDYLPLPPRDGPGVVLVHGYLCNRGLWRRWMSRLRAREIPFVAVDLTPLFASIESYAAAIADAVERVRKSSGSDVVVVAHSMGGLAIRNCLRQRPDLPVRTVVTIGTPHQGTWLARWGQGINARQMRPAGERLSQLGEPERTPFVCFWSNCDNIVFPASSATLAHADNRFVSGIPHLRLVDDARVVAAVDQLLSSAGDDPARVLSPR